MNTPWATRFAASVLLCACARTHAETASRPDPSRARDVVGADAAAPTAALDASVEGGIAPWAPRLDAGAAEAADVGVWDAGGPRQLGVRGPCEVTVTPRREPTVDCAAIRRVEIGVSYLDACFDRRHVLRYQWDANGRIVRDPDGTYTWATDTTGTYTSGRERRPVEIDARGAIVLNGSTHRTYDAQGRLTGSRTGRWHREYHYRADGSYSLTHNHPNSDEFCEATPDRVRLDAQGRVTRERYHECSISETERTLNYQYDAQGRVAQIDVDLHNDGALDGVVKLRYDCAAASGE